MSAMDVCPFCAQPPRLELGKKGRCQLHGEPFQPAAVQCHNSKCPARPRVEAGDVFNGGIVQAQEAAVAKWNNRARPPAPDRLARALVADMPCVVVPREATEDMKWATLDLMHGNDPSETAYRAGKVYRAMIAAATKESEG